MHRPVESEPKIRLNINTLEGFDGLHEEIKEGLLRLDFFEEHQALVEKIILIGKLTTEYLKKAVDGLITHEQVEEIYELQNILFTNEDLRDLAVPLFGSKGESLNKVDKKSWFWKLVNPLGGVPHLGQANEMAGALLAKRLGAKPFAEGEIPCIGEFGKGGSKTVLAVLKALLDKGFELRKLKLFGYELAPNLVEHSEALERGEVPDYLKDGDALEAGFQEQAALMAQVGDKETICAGIEEALPKIEAGSMDAALFSYMIHHLKCGEAFIRSVLEGRLKKYGDEYYYHPSLGEPILLDKATVESRIRSFLSDEDGAYGKILEAIESGNIDGKPAAYATLRPLINNPQLEALKDTFEKLKPGGTVIIADPDQGKSIFNRKVIIKDAEGLADFTSLEQMMSMLGEAGFENIEGYAQWEMDKAYYEENKDKLPEYDMVKKDFGDGNIHGYILAIPAGECDAFRRAHEGGIVDEYLGYFVSAQKPTAVADVRASVAERIDV